MKKIREGIVVSDKMNKTRVVLVTRQLRHSLYEKVIRKKKKYYVHDEGNLAHLGDKVKIIESRPLSRLKRWYLTEIVEKA
ncbi:MAG TPA: 30S ribosomal protein S17, partial [Elusimicrobia bacterium]|nr:30S ribosomal protein S17 [Elusimicrobiota bacterium]